MTRTESPVSSGLSAVHMLSSSFVSREFSFAPRTATATARSKPAPTFFKSAGERLIRTRSAGNSNPEFVMALLILSRDSFTAPSASPTMSTAGIPLLKSTSTLTSEPSYPNGEKLKILIIVNMSSVIYICRVFSFSQNK